LKSQVLPTPTPAHTPSRRAPSRSTPPITDEPPHTTPPASPSHNPTPPHTPHANAHRASPPPPPPDTTTDAHADAPHAHAPDLPSRHAHNAQAPTPPTPLSPCATPDRTQATPPPAHTPPRAQRPLPSATTPPSATSPRPRRNQRFHTRLNRGNLVFEDGKHPRQRRPYCLSLHGLQTLLFALPLLHQRLPTRPQRLEFRLHRRTRRIVWFLRLGRVVLRTVPCGCAFLVFRACCPCKGSGDGSCGRRAFAPVGLVVSGGLTLRRPLRLAGNPAKCLRW
jgi:hypothetical protein